MLFQTIADASIVSPGTYLTHLVMITSPNAIPTMRINYPIARKVLVLSNSFGREGNFRSDVIDMSFNDVNSGQLCTIAAFNRSCGLEENKNRLLQLFM